MSRIICNIILLCFVPNLYAPSNIYEEKVAGLANEFAKDYASAVNNFEKSYHSWVEVKNNTTTLNRRGLMEKQKFHEVERSWQLLRDADRTWQNLKAQVESLP